MTFSSDNSLNTNQLPISLDVNPDEPGFDSTLILYLRRIANAMNTKESGLYLLQETANFEQWYTLTPQQNRNAYRLTIDLVYLNDQINSVDNIPTGTTTLALTSTTQPMAPVGYLYPVQGSGGALDSTGISYFLNDPNVYVEYISSANQIVIYNNTGNILTWAVFSMSYLKN